MSQPSSFKEIDDALVKRVVAAIHPELYGDSVRAFDVSICFGQSLEDAVASARHRAEENVRQILSAAAPEISAQCLDEFANDIETEESDTIHEGVGDHYVRLARERAANIRTRAPRP